MGVTPFEPRRRPGSRGMKISCVPQDPLFRHSWFWTMHISLLQQKTGWRWLIMWFEPMDQTARNMNFLNGLLVSCKKLDWTGQKTIRWSFANQLVLRKRAALDFHTRADIGVISSSVTKAGTRTWTGETLEKSVSSKWPTTLETLNHSARLNW